MAHRKHVSRHQLRLILAVGIIALIANGCSRAVAPLPTENRGRVIDQDTGLPIAGALVVGRYMGSIAYAGASCDRIESAVSDDQGWFTIPTDSSGKPPFMEAYSPGYGRGKGPRTAMNGAKGDLDKWEVHVYKWDETNREGKYVSTEPTIYASKREAQEASREWKDVYLRRFKGTREERIMDLSVLSGGGSCGGGPQTSSGPTAFLEAIYQEQVSLNASEDRLQLTRSTIQLALLAIQAAKAREASKKK
jgi:hypothetical protein